MAERKQKNYGFKFGILFRLREFFRGNIPVFS